MQLSRSERGAAIGGGAARGAAVGEAEAAVGELGAPGGRRRRLVIVGAVAVMALALGTALGVGSLVPGLVPGLSSAAAPQTGAAAGRGVLAPLIAPPLDLSTVDWAEATIPGSVCGAPAPIRLRGGQALSVPSSLDSAYPQDVSVEPAQVVEGDVTGDGRAEAAVPIRCTNHDSTLAGLHVQTVMLFDGSSGRLQLLGTLASSQPMAGEIPNAVTATRLVAGAVQGSEQFYGPSDANCCPSGAARTVWPWARGALGPPRATVTTPATGAGSGTALPGATPLPGTGSGLGTPALSGGPPSLTPSGGPSGAVPGGIDITVPATAAARATPTIDQSTVTRVTCGDDPVVRFDDVVRGCNILTTGSALAGVVAVDVVSLNRADVRTYVMVPGTGCPGIPSWATKIDGDRSDHPCG